jgi:hypothetical protein
LGQRNPARPSRRPEQLDRDSGVAAVPRPGLGVEVGLLSRRVSGLKNRFVHCAWRVMRMCSVGPFIQPRPGRARAWDRGPVAGASESRNFIQSQFQCPGRRPDHGRWSRCQLDGRLSLRGLQACRNNDSVTPGPGPGRGRRRDCRRGLSHGARRGPAAAAAESVDRGPRRRPPRSGPGSFRVAATEVQVTELPAPGQ